MATPFHSCVIDGLRHLKSHCRSRRTNATKRRNRLCRDNLGAYRLRRVRPWQRMGRAPGKL